MRINLSFVLFFFNQSLGESIYLSFFFQSIIGRINLSFVFFFNQSLGESIYLSFFFQSIIGRINLSFVFFFSINHWENQFIFRLNFFFNQSLGESIYLSFCFVFSMNHWENQFIFRFVLFLNQGPRSVYNQFLERTNECDARNQSTEPSLIGVLWTQFWPQVFTITWSKLVSDLCVLAGPVLLR